MKLRFIVFLVLCAMIFLIIVACSFENDAVNSVSKNNITIETRYGDKLRFEISSRANFHHQFIDYKISLFCGENCEQNSIYIVLRDQPESVYKESDSSFSEINSDGDISLYELGDNYIFVYGNSIVAYPTDSDLFQNCTDANIIEHFRKNIAQNEPQ